MIINNSKIAITFILAISLSTNTVLSQTNFIERLTFSIVDTTKSKYEQVHNIYNWITQNISYDVKTYLKGRSDNPSVIQTIKKRRGICSDYSELFNEMCRSIGIESYCVIGYSKGTDYFKGGGFYRADHSWNAFRIDSSWFFVDATWGSGYLIKEPSRIDKIKFSLFKIPYTNTNYFFIKAPTDKYFNPSTSDFRKSHLPLDSNWQISDNITISQFENDSNINEDSKSNYRKKIDNSIGLSESYQIYIEGINGNKFNPKNNFDVANGYMVWADKFNCNSTPIKKDNVQTFVESIELFQKAINYILLYKSTIDSVYNKRLGFLKSNSKKATKLYSSIKNEISKEKVRFKKQNELNNSSVILKKRIGNLEKSITVFQSEFIPNKNIKAKLDSVEYIKVCVKLITSSNKIKKLKSILDTLSKSMYKSTKMDSALSLACLNEKENFNARVISFKPKLDSEDNSVIFPYWSDIDKSYYNFNKSFTLKKSNISSVQNKYNILLENISLMVIEYNLQVDLLNKFYRYANDSINTAIKFKELQKLLYESYNIAINTSKNYQILINNFIRFNKDFNGIDVLLKTTKSIVNIDYFVKFDNELNSTQKRIYEHEKKLVKYIRAKSGKALIKIDNNLYEFNENNLKQN